MAKTAHIGVTGKRGFRKPHKEIFVFGSNLAGRHTRNDALNALREHGAVYGRAVGLQGRSYAIPVRDEQEHLLPLPIINRYIQAFLQYARIHRELTFHVSRIGCGRDAYRDAQIAPLFSGAPPNCKMPRSWRQYVSP